MPPKPSLLSTASSWRCPQCTIRSISTSARRLAVGPEHPRYIDIPEPPQQSVPDRKVVKGVLPVPRNVFAGTRRDRSPSDALAEATKLPREPAHASPGSREEWKAKMGAIRRQNLREGLDSLRVRQSTEKQRMSERSAAKQRQREALLHRPEREDERLTAPSTALDLHALLKSPAVPDPTRAERLVIKARNLANHTAAKQAERMDALHTLYMHARDFIVTPQQLDRAVDEAFGTPEWPVTFGPNGSKSIWARGRPQTVQEMLNKANRVGPGGKADMVQMTELNAERVRRIAEELTGGKMDKTPRQ